jgi:uncharacterized protein YbaR (Trm112 family)
LKFRFKKRKKGFDVAGEEDDIRGKPGSDLIIAPCPYCGRPYPVRDEIRACPVCGGDLSMHRSVLAVRRDRSSGVV